MPPPSQAPAPVTKKKVKSKVPLARRQLPPPDDPPSDNLSNGNPEDSEEDTREDRSSLSSDEDQDVPVNVNPHSSDSMMLIQTADNVLYSDKASHKEAPAFSIDR